MQAAASGRALECASAREAGGRDEGGGVRCRRPHGPGVVEGGAAGCRDHERFRISGRSGGGLLREVLAVGVDRVPIEQRRDVIAVEAGARLRRVRLRRSHGGEQKEEAGEMSGAQAHGYLQFRRFSK